MKYTISQIADKIGVVPSTLRFYEKEGLLPFVERTEGGVRIFNDSDLEWLKIIGCLKQTGMPIKDIKKFILMAIEGDQTIQNRLDLIIKQKQVVAMQIKNLKQTLETLEFKEWYYTTAKQNGTLQSVDALTDEQMPARMAKIRKRLRGK